MTPISDGTIDDSLDEEMLRPLDEKEIVDLTLAIIAINGWNRLAIPFCPPPASPNHGRRDGFEAGRSAGLVRARRPHILRAVLGETAGRTMLRFGSMLVLLLPAAAIASAVR